MHTRSTGTAGKLFTRIRKSMINTFVREYLAGFAMATCQFQGRHCDNSNASASMSNLLLAHRLPDHRLPITTSPSPLSFPFRVANLYRYFDIVKFAKSPSSPVFQRPIIPSRLEFNLLTVREGRGLLLTYTLISDPSTTIFA